MSLLSRLREHRAAMSAEDAEHEAWLHDLAEPYDADHWDRPHLAAAPYGDDEPDDYDGDTNDD